MVEISFGKKKETEPKPGQGGGFFSKKPDTVGADKVADLMMSVNDLTRRVRVVEERMGNVNRRNSLTDNNMMAHFKKVNTEIKSTNEELMNVKKEMNKINSKMDIIIKELKLSARKEDLNVLQRYVNLWEPVNFVTQSEVESVVKRILEAKNL